MWMSMVWTFPLKCTAAKPSGQSVTGIKSIWKVFEAARHLWKTWAWWTAFSNSFDGSLNWEISSPTLQEVISKMYFDQPILACIQEHMRPLCSPVGLCSLVNLSNSHGKARLDANQTFMTVYIVLETTGHWSSSAEWCADNVLGIPQNAEMQTGYIALPVSSYTQFARKWESLTTCLSERGRNELKTKPNTFWKKWGEGLAATLSRKVSKASCTSFFLGPREKHLTTQSCGGWLFGLFLKHIESVRACFFPSPYLLQKQFLFIPAGLWRQKAWFEWASVWAAVSQETSCYMHPRLGAAGAFSAHQWPRARKTCLILSIC